MNIIPLKSVLDLMEINQTFSIVFYSANTQTGVAGERIALDEAILARHQKGIGKIASKFYSNEKKKRKVNRSENSTRLIYDKRGKRLITLHFRLITQFNGIPVRYGS